jgi:hypothetical protein
VKGSQREKGFSVGERGDIMNEEVETKATVVIQHLNGNKA